MLCALTVQLPITARSNISSPKIKTLSGHGFHHESRFMPAMLAEIELPLPFLEILIGSLGHGSIIFVFKRVP